jgi:hypothetical protein
MNNLYVNYTPEEIFGIEKEAHRLCSPLDPEADDSTDFFKETSLVEWRDIRDLVPWDKLYIAINNMYDIHVAKQDWMEAVLPETQKTVWDYCVFVSKYSKKEVIKPIKICGKECMSAAIFLTLKNNMKRRGLNIENLRPSSDISTYLSIKEFSNFMPVLLKTGVKTFDVFEERLRKDLTFWQKINILNPNRFYIYTGPIQTFKDLSKKICDALEEN